MGNIRSAFNRAPMNLREGFPQRGGGEGGAPPGGESAPAGGVHGPMSQGTNNGVGRSRSGVATAEANSLGGFLGAVATGITGPLAPVGAMIGALTNAIAASENNTTMTPDIGITNALANILGIENPLALDALIDNVISNPPTAVTGRTSINARSANPSGLAAPGSIGAQLGRGLGAESRGIDARGIDARGPATGLAAPNTVGNTIGRTLSRENTNNANIGVGFGRGRGGVGVGGMPPGGVHGPMSAAGSSNSGSSASSSGAPAGGGGFAPGPEGAGVRRHGGYIPHDGDEKLEMSPIKVHEGEFVISPEATAMIGLPMLRALNALGRLRYG